MQRLYPVLLAVSLALAVAIYLEPGLTKDFAGLARALARSLAPVAQAAFGASGPSAGASDAAPAPAVRRLPPTHEAPWPTAPAPQAEGPVGPPAVGDRYVDPVPLPPPERAPTTALAPSPRYEEPLVLGEAATADTWPPPTSLPYSPPAPWALPPPTRHPSDPAPEPVQPWAAEPDASPPVDVVPPPSPETLQAMPPEARPFERGVIVGRVGSEVILYSEIGMGVEEIRAQYQDHAPADELERQIQQLLKERLKPRIETKLIYLDAKRTIPAENFRTLEKRVGEHFEKSEIQNMIKRGKLESRQQLEEKLEAMNTSLEQQKRVFTEQVIAHQWLKQQAKGDEEVTCADMLAYYQQHLADYDRPARARWEQLMVRFARFPDKAEAYRAIAEMGNQVLGGKDFAEVARTGSHGSTAPNGGLRDWTTRGSLVSQVLDEAIFTLPPGALSPILEDEQGFHIVRVLEREEAHRIPFLEAQVEIRDKIRQQREAEQEQKYLARLWKNTPVWTVFDDAAPYSHVSGAPSP